MKQDKSLKLKIRDADDLEVVSGLMQDALVEPRALRYWPEERRFAGLFYRFCWEDCAPVEGELKPRIEGCESCYCRRHASLIFDEVEQVRMRGLDLKSATPLELLSLQVDLAALEQGNLRILLDFAGHKAVRLEAKSILGLMHDVGERTPTHFRPSHAEAGLEGKREEVLA